MITEELINPPQDVTAALASLQHVCSGWRPVLVVHDQHIPPMNTDPRNTQTTATEAQACQFVQNPTGYELHDFYVATSVLVPLLVVVVAVGWIMRLHHLPRSVRNIAGSAYRRITAP